MAADFAQFHSQVAQVRQILGAASAQQSPNLHQHTSRSITEPTPHQHSQEGCKHAVCAADCSMLDKVCFVAPEGSPVSAQHGGLARDEEAESVCSCE